MIKEYKRIELNKNYQVLSINESLKENQVKVLSGSATVRIQINCYTTRSMGKVVNRLCPSQENCLISINNFYLRDRVNY